MKKNAVTGAFSYSGKYITRRLLARGEEVITLTGHPDRPDPFAGKVKAYPLDFDTEALTRSLQGVDTLYNTYWIRFDKGTNTQPLAVTNTHILVQAAKAAGVRRFVHVSITNPDRDSSLPYFSGKAANEDAVMNSGMSYAILRPTVLFGSEDILINNLAWILRRFPFFVQMGNGRYRLQPVFVDDLAALAVESGALEENLVWDAVGPEIFSFDELVRMVGKSIGHKRPILHLPPFVALTAARLISLLVRDIVLTADEVEGLMADLLVSDAAARGSTRLTEWLYENRATIGMKYASELARHFR
jgi:NADH dehydrogenase